VVATTDELLGDATLALRAAGAQFAIVFGSTARGTRTSRSDVDIAAWWPSDAPKIWTVDVPAGVDLVDLSAAPLELAGRIACEGILLFDDNAIERVRWVATTRKIWLDERERFARSHREFLKAASGG
jgi:uncharacterized protein